ncbi:unnamed protein product, partial [Urochloa humidicola]
GWHQERGLTGLVLHGGGMHVQKVLHGSSTKSRRHGWHGTVSNVQGAENIGDTGCQLPVAGKYIIPSCMAALLQLLVIFRL